jgi:NDP-hexose-3-ketoreductase
VALLGCGRIGAGVYAPLVAAARDMELVGIAEPDPSRRRDCAAATGASPFATRDELLECAAPDLVVVATPAELHLPDAAAAAARGIPSLVEKPPAGDPGAARMLARLEPEPWVGFNRRFLYPLDELRHALRGVPEARLSLGLRYSRAEWRPWSSSCDALADVGSHLLDAAVAVAGRAPSRVRAHRLTATEARALLEFGDGLEVEMDCANDSRHREWVELRDGDGRRPAGWRSGRLPSRIVSRALGRPGPLEASIGAQLAAVSGLLAGRRAADPRLVRASEAVLVMDLIAAVRSSAELGGAPVELGEPVHADPALQAGVPADAPLARAI